MRKLSIFLNIVLILGFTTDVVPEKRQNDDTANVSPTKTASTQARVSPFGFGPYPEIPVDYPGYPFNNGSANHELIARVKVKLWKQGVRAVGGVIQNGFVYPIIPGKVYVEWKEYTNPDGTVVKYPSRILGAPDDLPNENLLDEVIRKMEGRPKVTDLPPHLEILSFDDGIEPYEFLDCFDKRIEPYEFLDLPFLPWNPLGGHASRAIAAATWVTLPPGEGTPLSKTYEWMRNTLPQDTVVAANWSYGSQLNVFGGVKTITDQDIFLQHWIHLYYRHVYCTQSTREALEFLKTHGVTHLMLSEWGIVNRAYTYSYIGSDEKVDKRFGVTPLVHSGDKQLTSTKNIRFQYISTVGIEIKNPPDPYLNARLKTGFVARLPYAMFKDTKRHTPQTPGYRSPHGGVILYYDQNGSLEKAYHISALGWKSFAVRLYFLGEMSDTFVPVYPEEENDTASVKVWKINYPPDIEANPKYLVTEPEALHKK